MWEKMDYQQRLEFLNEYHDQVNDILLTAFGYTIDSIVYGHLMDQLEEYCEADLYWEAC